MAHMLARLMVAGITPPDWRKSLLRSTHIGCVLALLSLLVSYLLSLVFAAGIGPLAGDALFRSRSVATVILVAVVWAPVFETVVAQLVPITFIRLFSKSDGLAVSCSALIFGVGHVLSGGGLMQGVFTATVGLVFASVFVANVKSGVFRASVLTAWVHGVHNGILIAVAMSVG
jgi:membrane protease YdiL (CAAX protease family)